MKDIIQKYKDLETRFNQMEKNHMQQMSQYKKDVSKEALRLAGQITKEKHEEIQQLMEELNQYKYKPGEVILLCSLFFSVMILLRSFIAWSFVSFIKRD